MAIERVRIPASWREDRGIAGIIQREGTAEFALGVGPCGKTVRSIYCNCDAKGVTILQDCTDGESKRFFYPMHTITGRVEIIENSC